MSFFEKLASLNPILIAFLGTLIAFLGTSIGACLIFFVKGDLNSKVKKAFLGFASGVMIAASIWSLLLPAKDFATEINVAPWIPMSSGFAIGAAFLFLLDKVLPHQHASNVTSEGPKSNINKTMKLFLAVTLHNIPEGMAVGLCFAVAATKGDPSLIVGAFALSIGIAIQNIPEGAIVSLPLLSEGYPKKKAFLFGILSGAVEIVAGVLSALLAFLASLIIPWVLAFAAGAMIYVVIDELVPDASSEHTNIGTVSAILGFLLMMLLDIILV
ncbi:MAG: ZIP family metal transporter [Acholeplasmatales bacterium]|jgi:ZIP family zinc transporter|nr:ZIP family metal transporter [Acholeplasmatales bacterium]